MRNWILTHVLRLYFRMAGTHSRNTPSWTNTRLNDRNSPTPLISLPDDSEPPSIVLRSFWNNLKYEWNSKRSKFATGDEVHILGRKYRIPEDETVMRRDFASRIWLTYRRDMPCPLPHSNLRSDCGWGCMIRSGQMILAQTILTHLLGRDWRPGVMCEVHRSIISLFSDHFFLSPPTFGLHRLVSLGLRKGKQAGDWFGPTCIVHILKEAVETSVVPGLRIYVAQDCTVYLDDVDMLCRPRDRNDDTDVTEATEFLQESQCVLSARQASDFVMVTKSGPFEGIQAEELNEEPECDQNDPRRNDDWSTSLLLFVPLRLGTEKLNPVYLPALKAFLSHECCVGVIGGKPKHSLYFIGFQGENLISMDPHFVQPTVDTENPDFCTKSYHCEKPRRIPFTQMDPSCCIGFYCRHREDFQNLVRFTQDCLVAEGYPLFVMKPGQETGHSFVSSNETPPHLIPEERILMMARRFINEHGEIEELEAIQEDFVFI
ncbi:unnamed protein product [Notodromas monacha]|uniref:Cysteine protease n=1 Tax=Notodromas monacha TaxID=399045 RepID=A0A7R9BHF6_9CRUS|nr:unnamed protein product [Notodromas monacha]CAG0914162.1 unnamed protein product [Notodromas monacha]